MTDTQKNAAVEAVDRVWSKPVYAAADKARQAALSCDPNDQMSALAAAVDAAITFTSLPTTEQSLAVAWMYRDEDGVPHLQFGRRPAAFVKRNCWTETALYAAPQAPATGGEDAVERDEVIAELAALMERTQSRPQGLKLGTLWDGLSEIITRARKIGGAS